MTVTRRHPVRTARWVLTVLAATVLGTLSHAAPGAAAPAAPTQLNATDMALLNGVRLAGLWEIPAGQMAAEKGNNARVRQIGNEIAKQHVELDELVVKAANKLGAEIPAEPTADQKKWLGEMEAASGDRFDRVFVDRLRAAHGKIFPVIGAVRAATRNAVVRALADETTIFVMNHMKMLESTGLVKYTELPPAAVPPPSDTSGLALASANTLPGVGFNPIIRWGVLATAQAPVAVTGLRLRRSR